MALHRNTPAVIEQGWIRALILLVLYVSLSVLWGYFISSPVIWFTATFALSFILVYLCRKFIDRRSFESIGFQLNHFYPDALIGLTLGTFLVTAGALIMYYMGVLNWNDIIYSGSDLVFNLGLLAMIAVSEELIFRGYVLRNLMKSFNKWIALGISAALFTIVHYSNQGIPVLGIINTFLGGLVLGISFILTRSLWLPIFFHLSWNFIQGPILGFKVSGLTFQSLLISQSTGKVFITGGEYGFEGSVICTILLAITVAAGCYLHENL